MKQPKVIFYPTVEIQFILYLSSLGFLFILVYISVICFYELYKSHRPIKVQEIDLRQSSDQSKRIITVKSILPNLNDFSKESMASITTTQEMIELEQQYMKIISERCDQQIARRIFYGLEEPTMALHYLDNDREFNEQIDIYIMNMKAKTKQKEYIQRSLVTNQESYMNIITNKQKQNRLLLSTSS
ncbi:unnamed protein product, partial [Didymodactylos carnosus]